MGAAAMAHGGGGPLNNGNFESGNLTGWTQGGNTMDCSVSGGAAHSGSFGYSMSPDGSHGFIEQTLTGIHTGQVVTVAFWYANDAGTPNFFQCTLGGQNIRTFNFAAANGYRLETNTVTVAADNPVLRFEYQHDGAGAFRIDDISVMIAPAQPFNGGFETGDLTGWTQGGNTSFASVQPPASESHSGNFSYHMGNRDTHGFIEQTLTGFISGQRVTLSFWLYNETGLHNFFSASLDGQNVLTLTDQTSFNWTQHTFGITLTSNNPVLRFEYQHNGSGFYRLDDVSARSAKCACDWNTDDVLNSQDFFDFIAAFFANDADYNHDDFTNSQDYFDFLTCFFTNCG
jgi:hypothetical protein